MAQEFDPVHDRHVPVQEHGVRHRRPAPGQGFDAIGGLGDLEAYVFQDAPGDFADHPAVVDDEDRSSRHAPIQDPQLAAEGVKDR